MLVIQFCFSLALLPSVFGREKPSRWTCGSTAVLLGGLAFVFWSLDLWLSMAATSLVSVVWTVLLFQRRY